MKKLLALLTVLMLLAGTRCFAITTASDASHKLECVRGNMDYTIKPGDTLSGIAQRYGQKIAVIASVQANGITDPNRIYAGRTMIIPCSTHRAVTGSTTVRNTKNVVSSLTAQKTVELYTTPSYEPLIAEESAVILPITTVQPFVETPDNVTVAAVPTQPEQAPISPPRSRSNQAKKVTGYRLEIPHAMAFDDAGISVVPLNMDLPTIVSIKDAKGTEAQRIEVISRAQVKGKDKHVVLSVSLKHIPTDPFTINIDGLDKPINGEVFTSLAQPFKGRFPGRPNRAKAVMFTIARIGVSGTVMSFTMFGGTPLGYPVAAAAWAIPAVIHHVNESADRKNAAKLATANANLAAAKAAVAKSIHGGS